MLCITCSQETNNKKFCSKSCSAKHNNTGVRRHGSPPNNCKVCGSVTKSRQQTYCSRTCHSQSRKKTEKEINASNAIRQSRYRAKQYRVLDLTANKEKIKEIYLNCPSGHEVDHIVPLSKGGKHHEDNLQYLTISENRSKNNRIWCSVTESNC